MCMHNHRQAPGTFLPDNTVITGILCIEHLQNDCMTNQEISHLNLLAFRLIRMDHFICLRSAIHWVWKLPWSKEIDMNWNELLWHSLDIGSHLIATAGRWVPMMPSLHYGATTMWHLAGSWLLRCPHYPSHTRILGHISGIIYARCTLDMRELNCEEGTLWADYGWDWLMSCYLQAHILEFLQLKILNFNGPIARPMYMPSRDL